MVIGVGKVWAAIKDDQVIGVLSMRIPNSVEFDAYRAKAVQCLSMLGEVKSGEVIVRDGEPIFVQRLSHKNRSKKVRLPKEYRFYRGESRDVDSQIDTESDSVSG